VHGGDEADVPDGDAGGSELMLALLADARLPTGAHTQSGTLEPALRRGLRPDQVPGYVAARLRTVVRVEAATAVVARAAAGRRDDDPAGLLAATWQHWEARTPSGALRESSQRLGRGQRRLVAGLWPGHRAVRALDVATAQRQAAAGGAPHPPRALVVGVTAACAGLSPAQTARLVAYDDVQTVAAATLKLAPLDPVVATRWVVDARHAIEALVAEVRGLVDPARIPASGAPLIDAWAEAHARADERLFSA
jgi:urease accessory protein